MIFIKTPAQCIAHRKHLVIMGYAAIKIISGDTK